MVEQVCKAYPALLQNCCNVFGVLFSLVLRFLLVPNCHSPVPNLRVGVPLRQTHQGVTHCLVHARVCHLWFHVKTRYKCPGTHFSGTVVQGAAGAACS